MRFAHVVHMPFAHVVFPCYTPEFTRRLMSVAASISRTVEELRSAFDRGITLDVEYRKAQLRVRSLPPPASRHPLSPLPTFGRWPLCALRHGNHNV